MALTVLDTSVLIAMLDASDAHHSAARDLLSAADLGAVVVPTTAYAEVLVGPARRGPSAVRAVDAFLTDLGARFEPVSVDIARRAAVLRARHTELKLPDALILATGDVLGVPVFTTDRRWSRYGGRVRVI